MKFIILAKCAKNLNKGQNGLEGSFNARKPPTPFLLHPRIVRDEEELGLFRDFFTAFFRHAHLLQILLAEVLPYPVGLIHFANWAFAVRSKVLLGSVPQWTSEGNGFPFYFAFATTWHHFRVSTSCTKHMPSCERLA